MPHIIIKMYKGRSGKQKKALADKITKDVMQVTECQESSISIAVEEFDPEQWPEKVYRSDILETKLELIKPPGYNPFDKTTLPEQGQKEDLMAYVREAAQTAAQEDATGHFNPMSWLDLELEDNPHSFDPYFDTPWDELSDQEKADRMKAIRRAL